jgi:predicted secreted acid phosphatase
VADPLDHFTIEGTIDEILDAVEARIREQWETQHPDGFEGKSWDEWQQEHQRLEADSRG